tara:strand:+ start:61 stop:480 length:420 start_codon:yes stop_codon:yes gene_type:complete
MTQSVLEKIEVGMEIPILKKSPITRTTLALFCGASGDHNPMHVDSDFAKKAGMPDVFAHGMLSMAYLAQALTNWVPQAAIRSYGTRFGAITHLNDEISCSGKVVDVFEEAGERRARLEITAVNQAGETKLQGTAVVCVD